MDKNLDDVLARRACPVPPSNLSARIIDAAKSVPQDSKCYKRRLLPNFPLIDMRAPALAFAVVSVLMVGAVFITLQQPQPVEDDVSLAFYLDDIFYVSEL